MTTAILLQTLVGIASFQMAVTSAPSGEIVSPQPENTQVLSAHTSVPQTATPTPTPTPETITYTTKPGDTIRQIAREKYGSEKYWVQIFNDNPELTDPAVIHPGLHLTIRTTPPTEEAELARALPTPTPEPTTQIAQHTSTSQAPSPTAAATTETETKTKIEQVGSPQGTFAQVYIDAGNSYGIPWQILYAVHKVESGLRDGPVDSGAGPQGPMQFLPSTWAIHGVDGNGDGVADINSAHDAIYSAANYLSKYETLEKGLDSYGRIKEDVFNIAQSLGFTP